MTMKTINRAYIKITPTQKFWNILEPYIEDKEFIPFHEPTLYLIEEDVWDEDQVLMKYMKKITKIRDVFHLLKRNLLFGELIDFV